MADDKKQFIKIDDDSNDKKYFTIIPNYVLNHSSATAQALYLQLKRLAGESGTAYPTLKYLIDKLGVTRNTLRKEIKYLLEKQWIKYAGEIEIETRGGKQKIKCYKIVDLWGLNNDYYKGGSKKNTPIQRGVKIITKGGSTRGVKIDDNKELYKKNHIQKDINSDSKNRLPKRKDFIVDKEIYKEITNAYQKYKGIELQGAEFGEAKRAIKTMLYSGRTKENILDFMKWVSQICKDMKEDEQIEKKYCWFENWTLLTIKRKMSEFLAGKFQDNNDIEIPSYARDWQK